MRGYPNTSFCSKELLLCASCPIGTAMAGHLPTLCFLETLVCRHKHSLALYCTIPAASWTLRGLHSPKVHSFPPKFITVNSALYTYVAAHFKLPNHRYQVINSLCSSCNLECSESKKKSSTQTRTPTSKMSSPAPASNPTCFFQHDDPELLDWLDDMEKSMLLLLFLGTP